MSGGGGVVLLPFFVSALRQATPLVLAGLGGILSERVGVVNIALEGIMLIGAFVGICAGQAAGLWAGLGAALVSGLLIGLLHLMLVSRFRLNHVISGVAINILALQGTTYLLHVLYDHAEPVRTPVVTQTLPIGLFIGAAILLPFVFHFLLYRTAVGLRLRAVGESPESARMAGIDPARLRLLGVTLSGLLAALAGAYLSLSQNNRFSENMVSGRGFIALAAVICGRWTPLGMSGTALAFGFFDSLQYGLQGTVNVPTDFLQALPYVCTILAAMLLRPVPPAALGREEA
jgi:simple sugar transport system permease protein